MKHILIVEDHEDAMVRMQRIVSEAFDEPCVRCANTIAAGRSYINEQFFDLAIIDLALPDGSGEEITREISEKYPNTYIVISTIHDESSRLLAALENGARGFLLKEQPEEHLIQEFQGILKGKPPIAPAITRRLVEMVKTRGNSFQNESESTQHHSSTTDGKVDKDYNVNLTQRESETLRMVANGLGRSEIATKLGISTNTVSSHISKIYAKLNIRNRAEATLAAQNLDLI